MAKDNEEQYLHLPGGRTLAYAESGNRSSSEVVMFFHGVFGTGRASDTRQIPIFREKGVHFIAPTLPGWGKSSSPLPNTTFFDALCQDTTALLNHLYPNTDILKLYIGGGSFGTVPAQMLYGAAYDKFPLGRHIVGLLLLGPFTPPRVHKEYSKCLTWPNYISVGEPSRLLPFIPKLLSYLLSSKINTEEKAIKFITEFGFSKLTSSEREAFEKYKASKGYEDGETERDMGQMVYKSISTSWEGFYAVAGALHSDWGGYVPAQLDEEHTKPVLIVLASEDWETTKMGEWLAENLKNSHIKRVEGGHLSPLFYLDEIWADFLAVCN